MSHLLAFLPPPSTDPASRPESHGAAAAPSAAERLSCFEWLRAGAVLGVILLHACVPYLRHPMPGLVWPVRDTASTAADLTFWTIELFIMPLFLVMAGYFAVRLYDRRDFRRFLQHRASRLLGPLVVVGAVILPLDLYSWLLGWVVEGHIDIRKMRSLNFAAGVDDHLWGLSHLWFLQYLFLYCVAYALCRRYWPTTWRSLSARYLLRRTSLWALLVTGSVTLCMVPEVVFGFQHHFLPFLSKWVYSGTFFAGGVWLAIYDNRLRQIQRLAWRMMWIAAVTGVAAIVAGLQFLEHNNSLTVRLLLGCATTVSAWATTVGLIGLATRYATVRLPAVRYVAGASFWMYLVHHPLIGLIHTDLKLLLPEASPILKAALAMSLTTAWCLLSFEVLVRRTRLGRLLGVPQPQAAAPPVQPAATAEPTRQAA
ncbi:acyltransferase family protein [Roseimaritima sediminicola]|uniref:acyltransferase family protein n=1 Tax=Roseimaritima sediminicola TaxID=2662066 RepID=UPI001386E8DE|nr:acyltransferase [Roseimaritima sediminicola]